ncbi:hypothetical protein B0H15DRAFT_957877 [Mycena belliarum]|uniref:Uncharacterized protein n=1 Tax=Mycena belliarum TaxID=1033014 RepID=A0AAD6TRA9_9AGAR|nr:hypothetical protein B0H15DRAFT_957877 [Mycena belliae]
MPSTTDSTPSESDSEASSSRGASSSRLSLIERRDMDDHFKTWIVKLHDALPETLRPRRDRMHDDRQITFDIEIIEAATNYLKRLERRKGPHQKSVFLAYTWDMHKGRHRQLRAAVKALRQVVSAGGPDPVGLVDHQIFYEAIHRMAELAPAVGEKPKREVETDPEADEQWRAHIKKHRDARARAAKVAPREAPVVIEPVTTASQAATEEEPVRLRTTWRVAYRPLARPSDKLRVVLTPRPESEEPPVSPSVVERPRQPPVKTRATARAARAPPPPGSEDPSIKARTTSRAARRPSQPTIAQDNALHISDPNRPGCVYISDEPLAAINAQQRARTGVEPRQRHPGARFVREREETRRAHEANLARAKAPRPPPPGLDFGARVVAAQRVDAGAPPQETLLVPPSVLVLEQPHVAGVVADTVTPTSSGAKKISEDAKQNQEKPRACAPEPKTASRSPSPGRDFRPGEYTEPPVILRSDKLKLRGWTLPPLGAQDIRERVEDLSQVMGAGFMGRFRFMIFPYSL